MDASFLINQFLNGLTIGMIYMLTASGLTLLLGVLGVLNFAHGSFYMLGAFALFSSMQIDHPSTFWLACIGIPLLVGFLGAGIEMALLRPLYERARLYTLLLTFGLAMVLDDLVLMIWGRDFKTVTLPLMLQGGFDLGDFRFPYYFFLVILLGPMVAVGLWFILIRTNFGKLVRAASTDTETLGALGINVKWVFTFVFALSAALAALGGLLIAPFRSIVPGMGLEVFIESFIVVVIGGLGSLRGAVIGALLIGQLKAFGILLLPNYAMIIIFALLLLVLLFKPRGLFGEHAL